MSLLVWLPLLGNYNNQGLDDATFILQSSTGTLVSGNNGKIGKCCEKATAKKSDRLRSSKTFNLDGDITMACWANVTETVGDTANGLITNHNHGDASGVGITVKQISASDYRISCNTGSGSGSRTYNSYYGTTNIKGAWHHLALTYEKTAKQLKLWVDGVLEYTLNNYTNYAVGNYIDIFSWSTGYNAGDYDPACKLNDVRIYDTALSPKEIELLSRGLVVHYPLNGGGRGGDNIISGTSPNEVQYTYPSSSYSDKFSKISTIVPSASQYVLSFWAKSTHAGDKVRAHWYSPNTTTKSETNQGSISTAIDGQIDFTLSDKWEKYWCVWTQSSTTAVKNFIFPRMFSQASGGATGTGTVSIKCVKLEEGNIPSPWIPNSADSAYTAMGYSSTTEYDVSGYGYNGTKNGTIAYLTDTPRYNVSTNIKGASSYIQIPNLTTTGFSNSYSFAWWGKVPSYQGYMMWGFSNGQRLNGIFNGNLWNTGDGASNPLYIPGTTTQVTVPTTKVWHHWVMTGDGTTCKVYQDGVLWGQAKTYKSISGTTIYINGWDAGTSYTYGDYQMSDFRIYATALSATQVAELYNTAVSVANNGTLMGYELVEV